MTISFSLGNAKLEEMNHLIGESFEEHYVRLGVTSVAVTVTFVGIFISGQGFEDEANNLALVVSEINWYTLNSKNKKRYVIFLINAMKPFRIQFSDEYVLNYQLGLTKLMEETNIILDDHLKVIKFMASDVFQPKIIKVLLWITLIMHSLVTMITVYCFLYVMDRREFVNYAAVFFGTFYAIFTKLSFLLKGEMLVNIKAEIPLWTIDSAGEKVNSRIKTEILTTTAFAIANFLLACYCCYCFIIPLSADKETFFAFRFCEDYFPDRKNILGWTYRVTFFTTCYVMIMPSYQIIYYTQHMKFQIMLFFEHVAALTDFKEEQNLEELICDQYYQDQIRQRLQFCIKRYTAFMVTYKNKVKEITNLLVMFLLCGFLFLSSIVFFLLSRKIYFEFYTRIGTACILACVNFATLILCGQSIENQSDIALKILNEVCWYTFNESNKKTYLIAVLNTSRPMKIKFSENYSINLKLGLAIVNGIYSIMSVMMTTSRF
ncbi:7tm 6 domain containing protein [Asbolus verrucosus]|uniref:Odorant receptor n=1 Tax=Asbolus verrucosus TaxID=1661398 RepID=A0A482V7P8_ASBVE|nr:7tm 6 domain containing protein [Asbolus verrucosus]